MTSTILIFLVVIVLINASILLVVYRANRKQEKPEDSTGLQLMLQQINELSRTVDAKLGESSQVVQKSLQTQFSESQRLIRDITRELTEVKETGKQVASYADQLQSLQEIFKNPKQRGVVGEYYLETLLKNVLPPGSFQMQYPFPDGTIADAVVFVKNHIIPIDSKFSLENYNRVVEAKDEFERERYERVFINDLKNRIEETSKYIQPAQNTLDFAFMFIPHEAIYYDLLINKVGAIKDDTDNLIQRAASKYRVIIVSPTSFLAYLQTVLQGLKALQIEESAKQIIHKVEDLSRHLKTYEESHRKLGESLGTAVRRFNDSNKEFKKIDKDMLRITGSAMEIEAVALDKPDEIE
jgi:DNA recombination protein RmuC